MTILVFVLFVICLHSIEMTALSKEGERFSDAWTKYKTTITFVAGLGERGQPHIDEEYEKLKKAHEKMSPYEQLRLKLPPKAICNDDGMEGGLQAALIVAKRDIEDRKMK